MEATVLLLAIVPAKTLGHASVTTALAVGGGLAVLAILLCGVVGRGRAGLIAGSVFQFLVIAAGLRMPTLYILGAIFAALWFTGIWLGRKWEGDGVPAGAIPAEAPPDEAAPAEATPVETEAAPRPDHDEAESAPR
jgi:hypothetical protein